MLVVVFFPGVFRPFTNLMKEARLAAESSNLLVLLGQKLMSEIHTVVN